MKKEEIQTLHKTAAEIGFISKYISIIQNSEELYIVNDDIFHSSIDYCGVIKIPENLKVEFKQKLLEYFVSEYNESVYKLKNIEL
jgi:hypothetical protein